MPRKERLISLKGARGSGKTTLLLQHSAIHLPKDHQALYVAMDDLFFLENNLLQLAEKFQQNGGRYLLLDEVHKYPNWSREIKLIYDQIPELQVVFTSSLLLEVFRSESDLSRRAVNYTLKELSLREYIELTTQEKFDSYSLTDILKYHSDIAPVICSKIKPLKYFNDFLKRGAYPFVIEGEETYEQKLRNVINLIIDVDLHAVANLDYGLLTKIKKLLYAIATSVPFVPNVSKLSERLGMSRNTLIKALFYLDNARLMHGLHKPDKGIGALTKPEKVYLNNTNILFSLAPKNTQTGTLRETFFVNQVAGIHKVHLANKGDFIVDGTYTLEIGGKNKSVQQIDQVPHSFLAKDEMESGIGKSIPIWLFGFLH